MAGFKLSKKERLSGSLQIRAVFKGAKAVNCSGARLLVLPNSLGYNRFLCTFRRGFGSSVLRNRVRRVAKEHFRLINPVLSQGFDLVLLVFSENAGVSYKAYLLVRLLKHAGLLPPGSDISECFNL
ncbi:MAG: ribonuclease P protein component [Treponema sp.]|nr:MAG: ribonuclease P protein component [Treponema sp.]